MLGAVEIKNREYCFYKTYGGAIFSQFWHKNPMQMYSIPYRRRPTTWSLFVRVENRQVADLVPEIMNKQCVLGSQF